MSSDNLPAVPETADDDLALAKTGTVHDNSPISFLLDTDLFNHIWRVSKAYSRSMLVPEQFRGKHDDCFVVTQLVPRPI